MHSVLSYWGVLYDDLQFLVNCCKTNPTVGDIDFIFSYLNAEQLDTSIGLAHQHGILILIYKICGIFPLAHNTYAIII